MIIRWLVLLTGMVCAGWVSAQTVHLSKIAGGVWYGSSESDINRPLSGEADLDPGYLRTAANGVFYGTTGTGSKFRIGPDSKVQINGVQHEVPCGMQDALVMRLIQGKMTAYEVPGAKGYDVRVPGGHVCMAVGLCVVCMHAQAAHIYVAKGQANIFPKLGMYRQTGLLMKARPTVAALDGVGHLEIQPLTSAAPGTSSCLLSGASPEVGAAIQEGSPNPMNMPGNPPVSETQ